MRILRHFEAVPAGLRGGSVALGNFDGFHRGHQAVLGKAAQQADTLGAPLGVVVTEPHPRSFFNPDAPPFRLMSFRTKAHYLERFGVDLMLALPFDAALASMLAQDFVMRVLVEGLEVRHLVVGYDYRFGKGRGGDVNVLRWMAEMEGFSVSVVEPVSEHGVVHSSSLVRQRIAAGDVRAAAALLGHWWRVEGRVETGDQRGRQLGFPTANMTLDDYIRPAYGVYAVRVLIEEGAFQGAYDGVANFGRRPTIGDDAELLEVHLFDFSGDIYGHHLQVSFVEHIRAERRFDGLDALTAQIARDRETARRLLTDPDHAPDIFPPVTRNTIVTASQPC